jgi:tetratricopeptide (TPR) repeat protein
MILRKAAGAACALVLFAGISLAQTSAISGEAKGEDGKPIIGAVIKIERQDIKGTYKVKTNKKGEYYYGGLPLGMYNVTLEVDGKDVDAIRGIRTRLGDAQSVNFDMKQAAARREAITKAAESGQLGDAARGMSAEQKAQLEKASKERQAQLAKNKELNDAFNTGMAALTQAGTAAQGEKEALYTTAVNSFKKGSELDAKQHVVWAHLGDSYFGLAQVKTGADQEAAVKGGMEAWGKAIEIDPNNAGYHNNYALALARFKKLDEARAELQKAAQLDPPSAGKYYYNLGALLVNSGQNDPAGE